MATTAPAARIRCWHCKGLHESVAEVKSCWLDECEEAEYIAQARAEAEVEKAVERWFETRGGEYVCYCGKGQPGICC